MPLKCREGKMAMGRSAKKSSYEFKYIYLVLCLIFIAAIVLSYFFPIWMPDWFIEEGWDIITDQETGSQTIIHTSENFAMLFLNIMRDVFICGLVGVVLYAFYEHRFESEEKETLMCNVESILSNAIEDRVVQAVLNSKEITSQVLSQDYIDNILSNCLIKKTGDIAKANAIMKTIVQGVINGSNTVNDLDVSMTLSNFADKEHYYNKYDTYKMTYVIRYRVTLTTDTCSFILTNNKQVQNENLGAFTYCQFVDSSFSGQEVFFKVNEVTIDGNSLRSKDNRLVEENYIREDYLIESCDDKIGKEIQLCYSVEFLVRKKSNHYSYFTPFMANGIHLRFDATTNDIKRIKLLPYFNSGEKPTVLPAPGISDNPKTIEINLNDWVLPQSGATFIWQYEMK